MAESLTVAVRPVEQSRGWERRWAEAQRDLERLAAPRPDQLSSEAIQAALHELQSFYIQAYHIKDALKAEGAVPGGTVEQAISSDPDLALLADLANLDKHFELSSPPRSGDVPVITVQGAQAGSGEGGWRLEATIVHHGQRLDGLQVARDALEAWRRHLTSWGLLSA